MAITAPAFGPPLDQSCVVEASAGTGKTTALVEHIVAAIAAGAAAPRVIDDSMRDEFLPVCGPYKEERVGEKSQPELKALKELRTWR